MARENVAANALLSYVRRNTWWAVANIFSDNGFTVQPSTCNGYICTSPSEEVIYTTGKIDTQNTPIYEMRYLVVPINHISYQQTITVLPYEHIQRWDALLFTQVHHYAFTGPADKFPVPKMPVKEEVMAMEPDPETGLFPGTDVVWWGSKDRDGEEEPFSAINLYPDVPEWQNRDKYVAFRVNEYREFQHNHELFCQAMNQIFAVSDCE